MDDIFRAFAPYDDDVDFDPDEPFDADDDAGLDEEEESEIEQ